MCPGPDRAGTVEVIEKVLRSATVVLGVAGSLAVVAIMIITVIDVVTRTITGGSFGGIIEYSEVILVFAVFLSLPYAQFHGSHVAVNLFLERMNPRNARILRALGFVIGLGVLGWMTWATGQQAAHSIAVQEYRFGISRVPLWPARLSMPIGLGLWFLVLVLNFFRPPASMDDTGENVSKAGRL